MARNMSLDSGYATKAIAQAVESDIRAEIEKAIREHIEPIIKEIATQSARTICENAAVAVQRDVMNYGGFHIMVKFGDEITYDSKTDSGKNHAKT